MRSTCCGCAPTALAAAIDLIERVPGGRKAIADLFRVVEAAEAMLASEGAAAVQNRAAFAGAVIDAQSSVTRWLEQTNNAQRFLLNTALDRLRLLTALQIGFVAVILLCGSALTALLKREVLMRRTRNAAQARVAHLAFHDTLTGLPNRAQFNERAAASFAADGAEVVDASLAFLDLDGFKAVNDVHGHQIGDGVLIHVGRELSGIAAEQGLFVARLGGDEFAAILPGADPARLDRFATAVRDRVSQTVLIRGQAVAVRASVGLAAAPLVAPLGPPTPDMMSRAADFALYRAKEAQSASRARSFDAELAVDFGRRVALLADLGAAVEQGGLEVWFQPKVLLSTRTLCGFEALVRWRRGDRIVPPDEFVSLAEESGLITAIDGFMLRAATQAVADWNRRAGTQLPVSVNLSAQHLKAPTLLADIQGALAASGLRPGAADARADRERRGSRLGCDRQHLRSDPRLRLPGVARRFRHRLFVARLSSADAGGRTEARPDLPDRHRRGRGGALDRRRHRRHRAQPAAMRRRRGHRDRGTGPNRRRTRLRCRAGLPVRSPRAAQRAPRGNTPADPGTADLHRRSGPLGPCSRPGPAARAVGGNVAEWSKALPC